MRTLKRWLFEEGYSRYRRLSAPVGRADLVKADAAPGLNIGCGRNVLPGWLNVDLHPRPGAYWMDVTRPWPLAPGQIGAALCEHMIEHVPKPQGLFIIKEVYRVLAPGGWVRFVTPDPGAFAERLQRSQPHPEDVYLDFLHRFADAGNRTDPGVRPDWCDALNLIFYNYGHRQLWSTAALAQALRAAGFVELTQTRAAAPRQPVFADAEGHPRMIRRETGMDGAEIDGIEAFAIEAMKPRT